MRSRLAVLLCAFGATASAGPHREGVVVAGRPARIGRVLGPAHDLGAWHASWDRDTGAPTALWGAHIDAPGAVVDAGVAERAARQFLAANLAALAPGAAPSDFRLVANRVDRGVRTVGFVQTWHGLRVVDAQLGVVFARDRLFAVSSTAMPNVAPDAPAAGASSQAARAASWVGSDAVAHGVGARVIVPIVHGPGDVEYRVADIVDVSAGDERWDVYVAPDGTPIERRATRLADSGTLDYNVGIRYAWGAREDAPAAFASVTVNGSGSAADGSGQIAWDGSDAADLVCTTTGSGVFIENEAGSAATTELALADGGSVTWNASSDEFADAQLSAYIYATIAHTRDTAIDPSVDFGGAVPIQVNNPGSCNGYSDGNTVFLYQASSTCENSARVADVVEHEFGHVFHNHAAIPGVGSFANDPAQAEGIADYNAANINEDPGVGRGLDFTDRPVRDIDPIGVERVYPTDLSTDPHISGEILSGALWDLRKAFIAELGHDAGVAKAEAIYVGVIQRSPDMASSYLAAEIADDDDGDLGDGVPDQCTLETAFGVHGLVDGYTPTAIGSPITNDTAISVPVTPGGSPDGCTPHQVTGMTVTWHIGSGAASALALARSGDAWTGAFPDEPAGTVIAYTVTAAFDDGSTQVDPINVADPQYEAFIGAALPIACWTMAADPGWTASGSGSSEWSWGAPPASGGVSGDPRAAYTGSDELGTILGGNGQGYYGANIAAEIATPSIDTSAYGAVHLQYWRWLTVEDGTFDQAQILANGADVWHNLATGSGLADHVDLEWRFQDVDVTAFAGSALSIGWRLTTDGAFELGGWNLDDVCLVGLDKHAECGDGVVDPGEQCDDGNTVDGDGCSATCQLEYAARGGCTASAGASPWLALLLLGLVRRRR